MKGGKACFKIGNKAEEVIRVRVGRWWAMVDSSDDDLDDDCSGKVSG